MFTGFVSFGADLSLALGCLRAAVVLHACLLSGSMRTPLSFFDTTPTGRILARFSKDIEIVDQVLYQTFSWFMKCIFEVIAKKKKKKTKYY